MASAFSTRRPALLLLGPTGSGKTPLGRMIEARGLAGVSFFHFDFGENLRRVVADGRPAGEITLSDIDFLRGVLATGALLEDEQFSVAERILRSFLQRHRVSDLGWVVLNGLPRHVGQAEAVEAILDVRAVVCLACTAETVLARLESDIGGDRAGRLDDDLDRVRTKLEIFRGRTAPLVEHYRQRDVPFVELTITATTTAEEAWSDLNEKLASGKSAISLDGSR